MDIKRFESGNVNKFVYTKDDAVYESVLYKYGSYSERTVMCVSVQSGCPVGCTFCGTGNKFIRNLTHEEIMEQVIGMEMYIRSQESNFFVLNHTKKFQIMFMSMGEPMLNWDNTEESIIDLNSIYPNAELLISTVGIDKPEVWKDIFRLSSEIDKIGLQFSIHEPFDKERNILIPYKNKLNLRKLRDMGIAWNKLTDRKVYLNFIIGQQIFNEEKEKRIKDIFSSVCFNVTFSVYCDKDNKNNTIIFDKGILDLWSYKFTLDGYNARIFNPDGQDDIGGGCGQLWYVQDWLKKLEKENN